MNKKTRLCMILLSAAVFLSGCSDIINDGDRQSTTDNGQKTIDQPSGTPDEESEHNDFPPLFYPVNRRGFSDKRQMEDLTSNEVLTELEGFDGKGYIKLEQGWRIEFELNVPTAQHYTIGLKMLAEDAVAALSVKNEQQGGFYLKDAEEFTKVFLHGIYLEQGINRLSLTQEKGEAYLDYLTVTNFELSEWAESRFNVSTSPANPNASGAVRLVMEYFGKVFGQRILLAQHVTPGTNAEIGAIFTATGRMPAIRFSDMMRYSRSYPGSSPANDDIDLAIEWAKNGGLVGYDWTWYSPPVSEESTSHFYAIMSDFNLNSAFTVADIAALDAESVFLFSRVGTISQSCYELILEIDYMAENLKRLRNENVVVLWRPMHQAGTRWFWWGNCDPEAYKWLWRLMFERFSSFHGLDNLIWVWAGHSAEYYPGDNYVDIIGEDIYNMDNASNAPRFINISNYTGAGAVGAREKFSALTECGLLPSPDLLNRDRAMWLWVALYRGDYLIDHRGRLASSYNQPNRLERIYNHELTITLDKLP